MQQDSQTGSETLARAPILELEYELNNRPDWVDIPLRGITEALREM